MHQQSTDVDERHFKADRHDERQTVRDEQIADNEVELKCGEKEKLVVIS
jgi:hypothetical protein